MGHRRVVPVQHPQQANGPQAVFLRFPARGQKAVHGPRASGGGAPPRRKPAPPARAEQGAGGADDRHQPGPGETAGAAPSPRPAPAGFAGGEFRRARAGAGGAAAALWAAIQCRAFLKRGVWGVSPCGETLPERRGSRATGPGARGASPESEQLQASGERARRPGGEGAAAAALPGLCRAWLFRGELLLHPLRGGLAAGCSCAAAHPPAGYSWAVRSSAWEMMLHAASQPCT